MATARTTQPPPTAPAVSDTRERIIAAGIRQCEEVGLRRTTMEDIAHRARLSRVTLYRHFGTKDELVRTIILAEADRFFEALRAAVAPYARGDDRLVEGFAFSLEFLRGHALFQRLLRTEPESLLPHLLGDSNLIGVARGAVGELIEDAKVSREDAERFAELLTRLVLSLALNPESVLGADDYDGARGLARRYLVPAVRPGRTGASLAR